MKKILSALIFLSFCLLAAPLSAQSYQSSVGLRLGAPAALSYKFFINETAAIELYGSYRRRGVFAYHYTAYGIGGTYQIHNDWSSVAEGLQWFYGGGAGINFYSWSDNSYFKNEGSLGILIHAALGLDYRFAEAPVNLSLDWKPTFALSGYGNGFGAQYGALSIRYILGDSK